MTTPWCPFSSRRLWPADTKRKAPCPHCGRAIPVIKGTLKDHRLPAVRVA